mmetsp:Transcript_25393/g.80760  ORF Transcript_25393/g.80760 Transcript_25393/m.80760 type:complete len:203 (-) Transcript_25393:1223-1831(-)
MEVQTSRKGGRRRVHLDFTVCTMSAGGCCALLTGCIGWPHRAIDGGVDRDIALRRQGRAGRGPCGIHLAHCAAPPWSVDRKRVISHIVQALDDFCEAWPLVRLLVPRVFKQTLHLRVKVGAEARAHPVHSSSAHGSDWVGEMHKGAHPGLHPIHNQREAVHVDLFVVLLVLEHLRSHEAVRSGFASHFERVAELAVLGRDEL